MPEYSQWDQLINIFVPDKNAEPGTPGKIPTAEEVTAPTWIYGFNRRIDPPRFSSGRVYSIKYPFQRSNSVVDYAYAGFVVYEGVRGGGEADSGGAWWRYYQGSAMAIDAMNGNGTEVASPRSFDEGRRQVSAVAEYFDKWAPNVRTWNNALPHDGWEGLAASGFGDIIGRVTLAYEHIQDTVSGGGGHEGYVAAVDNAQLALREARNSAGTTFHDWLSDPAWSPEGAAAQVAPGLQIRVVNGQGYLLLDGVDLGPAGDANSWLPVDRQIKDKWHSAVQQRLDAAVPGIVGALTDGYARAQMMLVPLNNVIQTALGGGPKTPQSIDDILNQKKEGGSGGTGNLPDPKNPKTPENPENPENIDGLYGEGGGPEGGGSANPENIEGLFGGGGGAEGGGGPGGAGAGAGAGAGIDPEGLFGGTGEGGGPGAEGSGGTFDTLAASGAGDGAGGAGAGVDGVFGGAGSGDNFTALDPSGAAGAGGAGGAFDSLVPDGEYGGGSDTGGPGGLGGGALDDPGTFDPNDPNAFDTLDPTDPGSGTGGTSGPGVLPPGGVFGGSNGTGGTGGASQPGGGKTDDGGGGVLAPEPPSDFPSLDDFPSLEDIPSNLGGSEDFPNLEPHLGDGVYGGSGADSPGYGSGQYDAGFPSDGESLDPGYSPPSYEEQGFQSLSSTGGTDPGVGVDSYDFLQQGLSSGGAQEAYGSSGAGQGAGAGAGLSASGAGSQMPYMPMMGGMGGMGGMGNGSGDNNKERERSVWLSEDSAVWGTDPALAPTVLGGAPQQTVPTGGTRDQQSAPGVPGRGPVATGRGPRTSRPGAGGAVGNQRDGNIQGSPGHRNG
ncbi:hypothetical protein [Streptomyces sp. AK02-01A]|uniref:hypothetical protein n=1 Tax=Streptomyces sp. AK02-01A TaxID=3028648 RepID=UPI0029AD1D29|nr:hypothetical protein [Streptomyces sp. AK02-01A]MDX3849466.1 hypothetical protein [Streptomyces sp. AK02-01A]